MPLPPPQDVHILIPESVNPLYMAKEISLVWLSSVSWDGDIILDYMVDLIWLQGLYKREAEVSE